MTYLKQVFQNIEEVDIMSSCKPTYISFILEKCPNVRRINLGASAELDNGTLSIIMAQHGLRKLEVVELPILPSCFLWDVLSGHSVND